MRYLLVLGLFGLGSIISFSSFTMAAAMFLWNDFFRPLDFAKAAGGFPAAQLALVVLVLSYAKSYFTQSFIPQLGIFFYSIVGMLIWIMLSCLMSPFGDIAWPEFITWLKYFIPLVFIYTAINKLWDIKFIMLTLVVSIGIWSSQAGVHCLIKGVTTDMGIPGSQMADRNDFTAGIVGTLPLLIFFIYNYDFKFKVFARPLFILVFVLALVAIVLSNSRGASLGVCFMTLFYITFVSKKKIRDFSFVAVLGTIVFFSLPDSWFERMNTIELSAEQTEGSAANRMALMIGAFNATVDKPIFGWGPGGWLEVCLIYGPSYHNPHSIWMMISSETGFTGLLIYLFIVGLTFVRLYKVQKLSLSNGDLVYSKLSFVFMTSLSGMLFSMTFLNRPFNEYLWCFLCLSNALPNVYDMYLDSDEYEEADEEGFEDDDDEEEEEIKGYY